MEQSLGFTATRFNQCRHMLENPSACTTAFFNVAGEHNVVVELFSQCVVRLKRDFATTRLTSFSIQHFSSLWIITSPLWSIFHQSCRLNRCTAMMSKNMRVREVLDESTTPLRESHSLSSQRERRVDINMQHEIPWDSKTTSCGRPAI